MVKAALLGKMKDAACIDIEEQLSDETYSIVIDSGANFLKAFRHFSEDYTLPTNPEETDEGNAAGDGTEDEMVFEGIDHLMDPSSDDATDEQSVYTENVHVIF